jgi:hypothetical protein
MRPQKDPAGEKQPGHHGPAASNMDPLFTRISHHQRAEGKRKWNAETDVAQIQHRRMDDHLWILQERI